MPTDTRSAPTPTVPPPPAAGADPAGGRGRSPGRTALWVLAGIAGVILAGNLLLIGTHLTAWAIGPDDDLELDGIPRARAIDDRVWRGRAPTDEGYRSLAARDVEVVVDLRAEEFEQAPEALLDELGLELVRIPIRDGQTPTAEQVERFMAVVDGTDGTVFVHCGAGVGRTGAIAAAYSTLTTDTPNRALLWENFSIGPPSFAQIVYAATVDDEGPVEQPATWVKAISRTLDGPRRIWHNLNGDV